MKRRLFTAIALTAATVCACINEETDRLSAGAEITVYADIVTSAGSKERATKTEIAPQQDGTYLDILWSPTDTIGLFGTGISNAPFRNSLTSSAQQGIFTGAAPSDASPRYAYYPYNKAASDPTAVPVTIATEQTYEDGCSIAANDIKASDSATAGDDGTFRFSFKSMATMLKIAVRNGTYTGLGDRETVKSITISDAEGRDLTGDFTLDIKQMTLTATTTAQSFLKVAPSTTAPLSEQDMAAYAITAPDVKKGDRMDLTLETNAHRMTFSLKAAKDFEPGTYYDITLDLGVISADTGATGFSSESLVTLPTFATFTFTAADNPGTILDRQVYYDDLSCTTQVKSVTEAGLTVGKDGNVTGCIPYLYNFNLKPAFTLTDSNPRFVVKSGGVIQTSGSSEQDFSSPVTYTIYDTESGISKDCTVTVTNTGLPIVVLTQNTLASARSDGWNKFLDQVIPSKTADFGTTDRIAVYNADGTVDVEQMDCGLRQRGNFSMRFPKKSMTLKLSARTKLLGMPKHKRWCLLSNYNDRTALRNEVSFELARRVASTTSDGSGLGWQPHGKYVELIFNGRHVGTYYLCEQIRQDKNRIDIKDGYEDVKSSSIADCGYLLEMDTNSFEYAYAYGSEEWSFRTNSCYEGTDGKHIPVVSHNDYDYTTAGQQVWSAVQQFVNDLDCCIYDINSQGSYATASTMLDMTSAADYMLTMELAMNGEYGHPKSVYLYKDGDGKLLFGPVWDFDVWTYVNISNINSMGRTSGTYPNAYDRWLFTTDSASKYFIWYRHLLKNQEFVNLVKERWSALASSSDISPSGLNSHIDTLADEIRLSMQYNDQMWPLTYTSPSYGYPNGDEWKAGSHTAYTFDEAVSLLKSAYRSRYDNMGSMVNTLTTSTMTR